MLAIYKAKCDAEGNYADAKRIWDKFEEIQAKEIKDKLDALTLAHSEELKAVEEAHKVQFNESLESWNTYIQKYEDSSDEIQKSLKVITLQGKAEQRNC
jgi:hypothetical protein